MTSRQAPTVRLRRVAEVPAPLVGPPEAASAGVRSWGDAGAPSGSTSDVRGGAYASTLPPPPDARDSSPPYPAAREARTVPAIPALRADLVSPAELLAARLPDGYQLLRLVHEGRTSDVWLATDEKGHHVAIKLARAHDPEIERRFGAEARALALLTHRSIVRLHAHGVTSDDRPFLALEWLEGPTLARSLEERRAGLPPADAIRLLLPIANALLLAHDRGFVHGDLRAEQVLLVPLEGDRFLPKLIDFGGVLRIPAAAPKPSPTEPTRPASQPPSDREGATGDPALDVRAFAALVFHAIMGRPPFVPDPDRPSTPPPDVPRTGLSERDAVLWRILAQALAPISVKRRQGLHDFVKALAQWADLRGVEADVTGSSILPRWSGLPPASHRGPPRGG